MADNNRLRATRKLILRLFLVDEIDMEMTDVILIFARGQSGTLDDEALAMTFAATNIERPIMGALQCTIPAAKLHEVERNPAVAYVRRMQSYAGSFDS